MSRAKGQAVAAGPVKAGNVYLYLGEGVCAYIYRGDLHASALRVHTHQGRPCLYSLMSSKIMIALHQHRKGTGERYKHKFQRSAPQAGNVRASPESWRGAGTR